MHILVLGGTVFLGRALTDAALASGHDVTHFNRGRSRPPDARVAAIHGDREDAEALARVAGHGPFDAVIDTCGYLPQVVQRSVEAFARAAGRYAFISSVSVYRDFSQPGLDEAAARRAPPAVLPESLEMELYGELKAGCEERVEEGFGDRALVVRPGLLVGPNDPTDRFTWWPARVARGGEVAVPGPPSRSVQFIDVRDVAAFVVRALEGGASGAVNVTGLPGAVSMLDVIDASRQASASDASILWMDDAFLVEQGVAPWREMPLWIPGTDASMAGFMEVSVDRALGLGLSFRPLELTVCDSLAWSASRRDHAWKAGLSPEKEAALCEAFLKRRTRMAADYANGRG